MTVLLCRPFTSSKVVWTLQTNKTWDLKLENLVAFGDYGAVHGCDGFSLYLLFFSSFSSCIPWFSAVAQLSPNICDSACISSSLTEA